jgi:hypothetical protein
VSARSVVHGAWYVIRPKRIRRHTAANTCELRYDSESDGEGGYRDTETKARQDHEHNVERYSPTPGRRNPMNATERSLSLHTPRTLHSSGPRG